MGQTIAEKIISNHAGKAVRQDELVVVQVDRALASDATAPLAIKAFEAMGGKFVWDPSKTVLVIDHAAPAPNERIANLHNLIRRFAAEQKCVLYDVGDGICHQLMVENSFVRPGQLIIGADSHTCTYGAVGALGAGVGSTDLAAVLLTGKIWLRVPRTIKVEFNGSLPLGMQGKDLILSVLKKIGIAGATYQAMEFCGSTISELPLSERMSIANMAVEAGAKTAFVHLEGLKLSDDSGVVRPDSDAIYDQVISISTANLSPMISRPHSPDDVLTVD